MIIYYLRDKKGIITSLNNLNIGPVADTEPFVFFFDVKTLHLY